MRTKRLILGMNGVYNVGTSAGIPTMRRDEVVDTLDIVPTILVLYLGVGIKPRGILSLLLFDRALDICCSEDVVHQ